MKIIILILLFALFACNNKDEKIIADLKKQHRDDSIQIIWIDTRYNSLYKENMILTIDTMMLKMDIDSIEYLYTKKHNRYYRLLQWNEKNNIISSYQAKIDKLQSEMDSIVN